MLFFSSTEYTGMTEGSLTCSTFWENCSALPRYDPFRLAFLRSYVDGRKAKLVVKTVEKVEILLLAFLAPFLCTREIQVLIQPPTIY